MAVLGIGPVTPTPMPAMTLTATILNFKRPQKTITTTGIIREMDVIGMDIDIAYVDIVTICDNKLRLISSSISRAGNSKVISYIISLY